MRAEEWTDGLKNGRMDCWTGGRVNNYFENFAVNFSESNSIVNFAVNCIDGVYGKVYG